MAKQKEPKIIKKLPKIFNKPYKEKHFQTKLLKHMATPADERLLKSLFTKEDGIYTPIIPPTAEKKPVKALAKSLKRNKKRVRMGRLLLLMAVLAILIGGTLLFKNRIAEKALEKGFSTIFQTEVDVRGTKLQIFQNSISYKGLEIVDSDNPRFNMVVMGEGKLQIDVWQLLQSNVIIHEILAQDLAWNVPRENYTAPEPDDPAEPEEPKEPINLDIFKDPRAEALALYEEAKSNLTTLPLVNTLGEEYVAQQKDFEDRIAALEARFTTLQSQVEEISKWNKEYFLKNPNKLATARGQIETVWNEANAIISDAEALYQEVTSVVNKIPADKTRIEGAVKTDLAYLEENYLITNFSTEEIVAFLGEMFLEESINNYLTMGTKVIKILHKLAPAEEKEPKPTRNGRIVEVGKAYPSFALGRLLVSYTDSNASLEIKNITSNAKVWGAGPEGTYEKLSEEGNLVLSFASTVEGAIGASFLNTKVPLDLPLTDLGIDELSGLMDMDFAFNTENDNLAGTLTMYNHRIAMPAETSKFITIFTDTIEAEEQIIWHYSQENGETTLTSSLTEPMVAALDTLFAELKSDGKQFLRDQLESEMGDSLGVLTDTLETLQTWKTKGEELMSNIGNMESLLDEKKAEIEGYVKQGILNAIPGADKLPSGLGGLGGGGAGSGDGSSGGGLGGLGNGELNLPGGFGGFGKD